MFLCSYFALRSCFFILKKKYVILSLSHFTFLKKLPFDLSYKNTLFLSNNGSSIMRLRACQFPIPTEETISHLKVYITIILEYFSFRCSFARICFCIHSCCKDLVMTYMLSNTYSANWISTRDFQFTKL